MASPIRKPLWAHVIDAGTGTAGNSNLLAIAPDVVAFRFGGRVCGFNSGTGVQKWCAGAGAAPAYAAHEFAYTDRSGVVRAVDAETGRARWHFAFPLSSKIFDRGAPREMAWPARDDFIIAKFSDPNKGGPNYGEISSSGRLVWTADRPGFYFDGPNVVAPYALQSFGEVGAHGVLERIRLGERGGVLGDVEEGWVLRANPPFVFLVGRWNEKSAADTALTLEVRSLNVATGSLGPVFSYQPDYAQNYDRVKDTFDWMRGPDQASVIRVAGGFVYGIVAGNLYRYKLAAGKEQRPLLIPGAYLGGPSRGIIYVSRTDSVWALRIRRAVIEGQLVLHVTPRQAEVTRLATVGNVTYIGLSDARFLAVSTDDGRTLIDAQICPAMEIYPGEGEIYVLCTYPGAWRIVAFQRL